MFGSALRTVVTFLFLLAITTACICIYVFNIYSPSNNSLIVNAQTEIITPVVSQIPFSSRWIMLPGVIHKALEGTSGNYSVSIINLDTNEEFNLNENRKYQTASLYKLWVMVETYNQIEQGNLTKDTIISDEISNLNERFNISSEQAEKQEGVISLTVEDALNKMITYSDNYSALLLTTKIRLKAVSDFLNKEGFLNSKVSSSLPTSTAKDISIFFKKLYNNELAGTKATNEMLDLLKKQQIRRKLPKYLPSYVTIAHKTGELDHFTHDAGIVYTPQGDYVIAILSESNNPEGAEERIAAISESVYKFIVEN